jgi:CARDB protein
MRSPSLRHRALGLAALGALFWTACSDRDALMDPSADPQFQVSATDLRAAISAQKRHTDALMRISGVVGTAVGILPNGRPGVRIYLAWSDVRGLPPSLDGVPVGVQVTGPFMALSDPTRRLRPAPLGYSIGHPAITAGTFGALVGDPSGNVYALSNNHVLANSNDASIGDPALQPGPFDGGTAADQIGTLHAFKPINFTTGSTNDIDAAMAITDRGNAGSATPTDDGYGQPASAIFGDANGDGQIDDISTALGRLVQKYGRTTKLTHGQVTGINATIDICYEVVFIFCVKSARFTNQLVITPGGFSGGGDSGSLIVTDDANKNPIGLLFAGSSSQTIANRIDLVLSYFGVTIDGGGEPPPPPPPPDPVTDIAITNLSAPGSVTQGNSATVLVTVKNVGTENVGANIDVTLRDATDNVTIGTQTVGGLAAGATAPTLSYTWNTAARSLGSHVLTATQSFADANRFNDSATAVVTVNAPTSAGTFHIGDLDGTSANNGSTWSATVEITAHDENHNPIGGVHLLGAWTPTGLASNECTTGDLGGNGTCIVFFPSIRKNRGSVRFTITSADQAGFTYQPSLNHDVDGSSNGTFVTVSKP